MNENNYLMMDTLEIIFKGIILPMACIYMAGLNLWLEFKPWFRQFIIREGERILREEELKEAYRQRKIVATEKPQITQHTSEEIEYIELEMSPGAVIEAKGITFEEMTELPLIMQGKSQLPDMDAAIIVAKASGTDLFDRFKYQIETSKQNINSLIDRVDRKVQIMKESHKGQAEEYFYENTGFSIRDFLPSKNA